MKLNDFRLSTRITAGMLLLVAVGTLLWIGNENRRLHKAYLKERSADLEAALHVEKVRLSQSIEALRQDAVFLAGTAPISGIVRATANRGFDPRDKIPATHWQARLQENFVAFLRARPNYFKVRFIGVADGGRELVRVESRDGRIEATAHEALQAKGESDYFKAGLALTAGRVHLSEFTLNQEDGRIEESPRPTLRAVTPIFDANGHVFGLVVINQDVHSLFDFAKAGLPPGVQALIADQQGHYLLHPDAPRAFSFELGGQDSLTGDFPTLKPMLSAQTGDYLPLHAATERNGGQYLAAERVYFDASQPSRFLLLAYHLPAAVVAEQMGSIARSRVAGTLLAMFLVGSVLFLMLRRAFAPLQRISHAAREIAAGKRMALLHEKTGGEIGELVDALNTMLDKLSDSELIERENAFRKELIDSLPGVFYMIDAQGRFLMWNRNLEQVLQRSAEEVASGHPLDFFAGEDKVNIGSAIGQVFARGEASVEAMLLAKDGTGKPYHFNGRRVQRDGEPVLVGMGLDITEQRESLRVTKALLQRNQVLMQNSMEGIHVMDIDGNVLEVNDAFCRMLGYTREETMQLNVLDWDSQFTAEELRAMFKSFIGKNGMFETVHRRKDGSMLDVEICSNGVEIDGKGYLFAASRDITERKKIQSVMRRHEQVLETAMDGFWMADAQGFLEEVNESYAKMSGYTMQELVGMHISQLEESGRAEDVKAHIDKIMAQGYDRFETQHRRKDGRVIDIEASVTFMPESRKFFVFCHNISRRKQAEQELRVAAATFETHDAILITDAQSNIIRVNRAFTEITGYSAEEVLGKNPRIMNSGKQDRAFYSRMWQRLLHTGMWAGEIWDRRKNGETYPKWLSISAVKNERQETTQYVAIFSDITERKRAEEEIRNMAFYDALTQLPNRRLFLERLQAALTASSRYDDFGALLFIDLDRFKLLNDTHGHDHGDLLLVEVASRIKSCGREMDTVARLGGDEFVVLLESISSEREDAAHKAGLVAEKIREALAQPYFLKGHEHSSSPSIGICLLHGGEESMDELIKHADAAMYQAKDAGGNTVCLHDPNRAC
jgi:diguanylate cyclase (GGDEF)-like protein/PAS domain S-box-containing protein